MSFGIIKLFLCRWWIPRCWKESLRRYPTSKNLRISSSAVSFAPHKDKSSNCISLQPALTLLPSRITEKSDQFHWVSHCWWRKRVGQSVAFYGTCAVKNETLKILWLTCLKPSFAYFNNFSRYWIKFSCQRVHWFIACIWWISV